MEYTLFVEYLRLSGFQCRLKRLCVCKHELESNDEPQ